MPPDLLTGLTEQQMITSDLATQDEFDTANLARILKDPLWLSGMALAILIPLTIGIFRENKWNRWK